MSQPLQRQLGRGGVLEVNEIERVEGPVDPEHSALVLVTVWCCFVTPVPHSLLTICSM